MSIVVAVTKNGRTAMAADTQSNFGSEVLPSDNLTTTKIRRVGDSVLGRTGWGVYDNILADVLGHSAAPELDGSESIFRFFTGLWKLLHQRYAFVNDQSKRKNSPFGDLGGSFLVANGNGIFYVAPNLGVTRFAQGRRQAARHSLERVLELPVRPQLAAKARAFLKKLDEDPQ